MRKRHIERHALQRAHERFGVEMSAADLRQLEEQIRRGQARFVHRISHSRTLWLVTLPGDKTAFATYLKNRGQIGTLLIGEMWLTVESPEGPVRQRIGALATCRTGQEARGREGKR